MNSFSDFEEDDKKIEVYKNIFENFPYQNSVIMNNQI